MINAKDELLNIVSKEEILCATVQYIDPFDEESFDVELPIGWHESHEMFEFLNNLDFTYDDGYGIQFLFGVVWLKNGDWLERDEYDGSEHWVRRYRPAIPDSLQGKAKEIE